MDITKTPPEEYAAWLRSRGVPEADIDKKMASDTLRAVSGQISDLCSPFGPEETLEEAEARFAEFMAQSPPAKANAPGNIG